MDVHECVILRLLVRHRIIGEKHTDIVNLTKGLPKHARGKAKKIILLLLREKLLLRKPTSYGLHVSLNPEKLEEVFRRLED